MLFINDKFVKILSCTSYIILLYDKNLAIWAVKNRLKNNQLKKPKIYS